MFVFLILISRFSCVSVLIAFSFSTPYFDKKSSISQGILLCNIAMKYSAQTHRVGLRRAIIASVAIHFVLVAIVVVCTTMSNLQLQTSQVGFDTRVEDVRVQLDPEESTNLSNS